MAEKSYSYQTGEKNTFTPVDYVLFGALLLLSTGIGLLYAIKDRNRNTTKEFFLAGGNMHVLPVALSLLASFMSAITILGTPSEMYSNGTMYGWIGISYILAIFLAAHIYVPVFYRLRVTSTYEYLERRFGKATRLSGSVLYIIQMLIYMACVLYAPSLALNAVTGFTLWGSIWAVGAVCTFYTSIGGMKAVLWTDTLQCGMMVIGLLAILIQGSIELDGFKNAWDIASNNSRTYLTEFSPDPTVRHSAWTLMIGGIFFWGFIYGLNQAQVQRAVTCPTLKKAQLALWLNLPGLACILYLSCMIGIVIYAFYSRCDPKSLGLITASDQILPLFVMDVLGRVPGIPGLFVACLFSGTLSTISSGLNSMSAVILQDIIRKVFWPKMSEKTATIASKLVSVCLGVLSIGLAYVASTLGDILQAAIGLIGMLGGPLMGLFTLGMLFPWANQWGALSGLYSGLGLVCWIGIGYNVKKPKIMEKLPFSTVDCNWNLTSTASPVTLSMNFTSATTTAATVMETTSAGVQTDEDPVVKLYTLSYMWYTATGVLTVVVVGLLVSFITGYTRPSSLDPLLMCPFFDICFPCLPEKIRRPLRFGVKYDKKREENGNIRIKPGEIMDKSQVVEETGTHHTEIDNPCFTSDTIEKNGKIPEIFTTRL